MIVNTTAASSKIKFAKEKKRRRICNISTIIYFQHLTYSKIDITAGSMRLHEEDSWHIQYGHLVYNCNLEMSLASSNELKRVLVCNFITA
jgi:hypothetical protein